jgi:hypothetical protein
MRTKIFICLLIIGICTFAFADERGCTHKEIHPDGFISVGHATPYEAPESAGSEPIENTRDGNWILTDSLELSHYVDAGGMYSVYFNNDNDSLEQYPIYSEYTLLPESKQAIAKAPKWLRNDLYNVLSRVNELHQPEWASAINAAEDPYIDEIAFAIAHSSPEYLSANFAGDLFGSAELFQENAEMIYNNAQYLNYVEVVDYGTSTTDENYYSTTRYKKVNAADDTVQVEVPKEIYYWYIVDPKITDEIPAYIDPNIVEDNTTHTNNFADPPTGYFWRDYLFNMADDGYPILRDSLADCQIVWDGTQNVNASKTHALAIITRWIRESLDFTSNFERPHQPVRIYKKHIGRCGEHADITAAATRAALIPCSSILAISGDHTWNEFWDDGWVHWEPVNNSLDNPLVYENGWGKVFGSVFEIRSDGWLNSVTERYSEGSATITIYALDNLGNPIDGAEVLLGVQSGTSILVDNYGITDNEGKYTFIVGEGRHYHARIDTEIGSYPQASGTLESLVENTVSGEEYIYSMTVTGTMPVLNHVASDIPEDTVDDYLVSVEFTVPSQIVTGLTLMDDIDNSVLYKKQEIGSIDYVMTDELSFIWFMMNIPFACFNMLLDTDEGEVDFNIPVGSDWYCNFSNILHLNNLQVVEGFARLYSYVPTSVDDPDIHQNIQPVLVNSPNPFIVSTTISYFGKANINELTCIKIFNIKGQKVRALELECSESGLSAVWDGNDQIGRKVSPGIYFYRIDTGDRAVTKKCVVIR